MGCSYRSRIVPFQYHRGRKSTNNSSLTDLLMFFWEVPNGACALCRTRSLTNLLSQISSIDVEGRSCDEGTVIAR
jgi:hypothetical protein